MAKKQTKAEVKRRQIVKGVQAKAEKFAEPSPPSSITVRIGDIVRTKSDGSFLSDIQGIIIGNQTNESVTVLVDGDMASNFMHRIGQRVYEIKLSQLDLVQIRIGLIGVYE